MRKFYVFDNSCSTRLICIINAFRFTRVLVKDVVLLTFYDDKDNDIAYFDDSYFIVRDNVDIFSKPALESEGVYYD